MQDSKYRGRISAAILKLKENGIITNLTEKWWETENTVNSDGEKVNCTERDLKFKDDAELGMNNLGGIFFVLVSGLILSIFVGILEFIWSIRQTSINDKVIEI